MEPHVLSVVFLMLPVPWGQWTVNSSQVATHPGTDCLLKMEKMDDSNPGLHDNNLVRHCLQLYYTGPKNKCMFQISITWFISDMQRRECI